MALVYYTGDWLWKCQSLHETHSYKSNEICEICFASTSGEFNYCNFAVDAPYSKHLRSNATFMASISAQMSPLTAIPGFHIHMSVPECMHAGPLGTGPLLAGGSLLELADEDFMFGRFDHLTEWKGKLYLQLAFAYTAFIDFCKRGNISSSQKKFSANMLRMRSRMVTPNLRAKAHNCMVVIDWLSAITAQQATKNPGNEYMQIRACALWGFSQFFWV